MLVLNNSEFHQKLIGNVIGWCLDQVGIRLSQLSTNLNLKLKLELKLKLSLTIFFV